MLFSYVVLMLMLQHLKQFFVESLGQHFCPVHVGELSLLKKKGVSLRCDL